MQNKILYITQETLFHFCILFNSTKQLRNIHLHTTVKT